jgi:glycosyltransferase involved in cell wall biosynthesis
MTTTEPIRPANDGSNTAEVQPDSARMPLVSVVIPTYNRAHYLPEAIDSVLAQTYPNLEIVVVDDGSTDHTAQVMERYIGKVTYQRKQNGGVASARNLGLQLAHGEFVAFLDSDDICLPQRIAAQIACFFQVPDAIICSSDFSAFNEGKVLEASHIATYYRTVADTPGGLDAIYSSRQTLNNDGIHRSAVGSDTSIGILVGSVYEHLAWGNFIHPPTIMVRRAAIDAAGVFDESIPIATEHDWLLRVCRTGRAAYLDSPMIYYRYSGDQLSSPRHTTQISLDSIATITTLRRTDPELYRRHLLRFTRRIGTCYLNAANASLETNKFAASGHLLRSVTHGVFNLSSLKVIGKLVLPRKLLNRYRNRRAYRSTDMKGHIK